MSDKTIDQLRDLLGVGDGDCERLLRAAADCYVDGDFDKTEVILAGLIALTDDVRPLKLLASTLFLTRKHGEAAQIYEQVNKIDPDDPYVLVALGELKLKTMRYDEAIPIFRRLFELDPEGQNPAANRGRFLVQEHCKRLQESGHES